MTQQLQSTTFPSQTAVGLSQEKRKRSICPRLSELYLHIDFFVEQKSSLSCDKLRKAVSCLTLTPPRGNRIDNAPGGKGTDCTAGGVCSSLSSHQHDRGPHCSSLYTASRWEQKR